MADKELLTALLDLREPWYIARIDVEVAKEEAHVTVAHHHGRLPCPTCGTACLVEDHSDERIIRHLDLWQAKTFIHVAVPRTRCPEHGVLRVALPFAEPGSRFTMAFEERTIATILACQTVKGASDQLRISWEEARGIMERAVQRGLGRRTADIVPYLGVDEKAIRKGHRYVTVLTDPEGRRIRIARGHELQTNERHPIRSRLSPPSHLPRGRDLLPRRIGYGTPPCLTIPTAFPEEPINCSDP